MYNQEIMQSLENLCAALPQMPTWAILITHEGEVLSRVGQYKEHYDPVTLNDESAASWIRSHGLSEIKTLEGLTFGTFQHSISFSYDGMCFIINLHGGFFLGISYTSVFPSYDAVIDAILDNFLPVLEAAHKAKYG